MEYPLWAWVIFFVTVSVALFVDVAIVNRHSHVPTRRETFVWSAVWVSLALAFNGFIYWMVNNHFGDHALALTKTKEFFTGYLIELSLSVDNLFIFLLIFGFFKVPKKFQHRVLFWGIIGALLMRMIMIFAGAELVERFHWIIYIFGFFLLYTGIKMFSSGEDDFDIENSSIVGLTTRFIPLTKEFDGEKFFVVRDGKRMGTLLLLVLIVVEFTDLIFAVDSIPAIFGITTDKFIVYTSNIFAILGLRTFFFLLADLADRFHYLKIALAFILSFIGVKMLLPLAAEGFVKIFGADGGTAFGSFLQRYQNQEFNQTIVNISLGVVVGAIVLAIVFSIVFPPSAEESKELLDKLDDQ